MDKTEKLFQIVSSDDLAEEIASKLSEKNINELITEVTEVFAAKHRCQIEHVFNRCRTQKEQLAAFREMLSLIV